jgi:hypothetical protein
MYDNFGLIGSPGPINEAVIQSIDPCTFTMQFDFTNFAHPLLADFSLKAKQGAKTQKSGCRELKE